MNDPRRTLEEAQAERAENEKATAYFAALGATEFYLRITTYCDERKGADQAWFRAWLAELNSRLHQLEGWAMAADESPWKPFAEREAPLAVPLFLRWPDADGTYTYTVVQVGFTAEALADRLAFYVKSRADWMRAPK